MAKRKIIEIPGLSHATPIPIGAKIGNMVFSSAISGRDAETNEWPKDSDKQAEVLIRNIRKFMELAGGKPDDIGHMTVSLKEERYRDSINKEWLKMFPPKEDRPARHAIQVNVRSEVLFQIDLIAVL